MRRQALRRRVGEALVTICRGGRPTFPEELLALGHLFTGDLVAGARYHRIAPLAHVALRAQHPELAALFEDDRTAAVSRHLHVTARLGALSGTLSGLRWLTFKGPVLSEFAHPVPGLRFYKDLDVLVSPANFREACTRLLDEGWRVLLSAESLESEELPGELAFADRSGLVLDLHWAMVVSRSVRSRFTSDADALLARRRPVTLGPTALSTLSHEDAVVHVALHAALIGATKLGHLLDADQLARQVDDWDAVVQRAGEWGAPVEVAAVLGRAERILGTRLPADLAARLGVGAGMRRLLAELDRRRPVQRLRGDASVARLVTRALRPGLAATGGRALQRAASGVSHRIVRRAEPARNPTTPEVLDAYLARVEAAAS